MATTVLLEGASFAPCGRVWGLQAAFICHKQGIEAACKRLSLAQNVADAGVFVELGFGKRAQRDDFEVFLARKRD